MKRGGLIGIGKSMIPQLQERYGVQIECSLDGTLDHLNLYVDKAGKGGWLRITRETIEDAGADAVRLISSHVSAVLGSGALRPYSGAQPLIGTLRGSVWTMEYMTGTLRIFQSS